MGKRDVAVRATPSNTGNQTTHVLNPTYRRTKYRARVRIRSSMDSQCDLRRTPVVENVNAGIQEAKLRSRGPSDCRAGA